MNTVNTANELDVNTTTAAVDAAMYSRKSVRAFLPKPVPRELLEGILRASARAPSGTNTQPWHVHVLQGRKRDELVTKVCAAFDAEQPHSPLEYHYYPEKFPEPYLARRRKVGWDLYGMLGIGKGDREKTRVQHRRNYELFDAPVALLFAIDRQLATGSFLDYGMFLENVMLAARARGLDTCPQAAWTDYNAIVREVIGLPPEHILVCGMALGYADPGALVNTLVTERAPLEEFVRFYD
jgi:nitroreductase